jgi:hypothetical protein
MDGETTSQRGIESDRWQPILAAVVLLHHRLYERERLHG